MPLVFTFSCGVDFTKDDTKKEFLYGLVTEKYRDEHNHLEPTIVYKNKSGEFEYQMSDWNLWDYLQTGDSIIKPSGTLTLRVKKVNGEFKDFEYQN